MVPIRMSWFLCVALAAGGFAFGETARPGLAPPQQAPEKWPDAATDSDFPLFPVIRAAGGSLWVSLSGYKEPQID